MMDALAVPETYFWREIDQMRGDRRARRAGAGQRRVPCDAAADLERALRERRGAADDRDGAARRRGWFDRVPIEIHGSDASPAAIAAGARRAATASASFRTLPPALREKYFAPRTATPGGRRRRSHGRVTSWSVVNLLDDGGRSPRARRVPIVFCRNVFIYFSRGRRSGASSSSSRGAMPSPGVSLRRRVGVAAAGHVAVRARGDRRRVRLREATVSQQRKDLMPEHRPRARRRRLGLRPQGRRRRCSSAVRSSRWSARRATAQEALELVAAAQARRRHLRPQHAGDGRRRLRPRADGAPAGRRSSSSASRPESGEQVLAALDAGAIDFVQKPTALATERLMDIGGRAGREGEGGGARAAPRAVAAAGAGAGAVPRRAAPRRRSTSSSSASRPAGRRR